MRQPNDIMHKGKTIAEWLEYNKTQEANLSYANLSYANLSGANLSAANLSNADLRYADLSAANLRDADLRDADLRDADLRDADLRGARNVPEYVSAVTCIIPDGDVVGWKKCGNGVIVKLLIGADVPRSNATGRKCRSKSAVVLEVIGAEEGVSSYDNKTVYRVGETVECDEWNTDRWAECGGGIHWFITRHEAEQY